MQTKARSVLSKKILWVLFVSSSILSYAEETKIEKAETVMNKSVDKAKSTARDVDNQICEMIDGQMKCVVKKIKNKLKNAKDTTKTKATEIQNKIDN